MEVNVIQELIGNLGVPTAMCVALMYMLWKNQNQQMEIIKNLEKTVALNTVALTTLSKQITEVNNGSR